MPVQKKNNKILKSLEIGEANATIANIFALTSDYFCLISDQGKILSISQSLVEKLSIRSSPELIGSDIANILMVYGHHGEEQSIQSIFEGDQTTYDCLLKGSSPISATLNVARIENGSNGEITKVLLKIVEIGSSKVEKSADEKSRLVTRALQKTATAIYAKLKLSELLDEILAQIGRVISFDTASISLLENEDFRIVASRGFHNPLDIVGIKFPKMISPELKSPNFQSIETRQSFRLNNIPVEYPEFVHPPDGTILSWLVIPLLTKDSGIGTLNLDSFTQNHFTSDDQRIGELFAAQVSIAIENAVLYKQLEHNATYDELTGAYNRRHFLMLAEMELAFFNPEDYPISFIMVDLDNFKTLNHSFGHSMGDLILSSTAKVCRQHMRHDDSIGRYGGDEFLFLLPNTSISDAIIAAHRLSEAIVGQDFSAAGLKISVTASLGVSTFLANDTIASAIERADKALYLAKQSGRNQVVAMPS